MVKGATPTETSSRCEFGGLFVVRTPLLPAEDFLACVSGTALEARLKLAILFRRPEAAEALYVASRSLHARVQTWRPEDEDPKALKTAQALYRYLSRIAFRCTPFGLSAGVSWAEGASSGSPAGEGFIQLDAVQRYQRRSRIDASVLTVAMEQWISRPELLETGRYRLNPTLYEIGGRWHFVEPGPSNLLHVTQRLSYAEMSPALDALMAFMGLQETDISHSDLRAELSRIAPDTTQDERDQFIFELASNRLIVSDMRPTVSGHDLDVIIERSRDCSISTMPLQQMQAALSKLNTTPVGDGLDSIRHAEQQVGTLLACDPPKNLLQTDLFKPLTDFRLPEAFVEMAGEVAPLLSVLTTSTPGDIEQFKKQFSRRFGQRQVPLLEALDPSSGLPFGNSGQLDFPLLHGLHLKVDASKKKVIDGNTAFVQLLLKKLVTECPAPGGELVLGRREVGEALPHILTADVPTSFMLTVQAVRTEPDGGHRPYIRAASGPSAANLVGRFCYGDERLEEATTRLLQIEQDREAEGAIMAELVHEPLNRIDNVLIRPPMRDTALAVSGRPPDVARAISLRDLLVSIQGPQVVLIDRISGRRVIPRLTSAYNYRRDNIPLYEFLAALQRQEPCITRFVWPSVFDTLPCLPRLSYAGCVIAPATWSITKREYQQACERNDGGTRSAVADLRSRFKLPRFVEVADSDNALLFDLDSDFSVENLAQQLRSRSVTRLIESYPATEFVTGPEGRFWHEIGLTFLRSQKAGISPTRGSRNPGATGTNGGIHPIGSEWLYLSLYVSPDATDRVLSETIARIVERLSSLDVCDRWFFIRYADPDFHIRLRVRSAARRLWSEGLSAIREVLDADPAFAHVWRTSVDEYEPEVIRYGGEAAMRYGEEIFQIDSEAALGLISNSAFQDPTVRWRWIAYGVDRLWTDFGIKDIDKVPIFTRLASDLHQSAFASRAFKPVLDAKYRAAFHSRSISNAFGLHLGNVQEVLDARSRNLEGPTAALRQFMDRSGDQEEYVRIVASHVHMSVDRLCIRRNTEQEAVIYALLARYHRSKQARAKSVTA